VAEELDRRGYTTKAYQSQRGRSHGGLRFQPGTLLRLLTNALYVGKVEYRGEFYPGEHEAIVEPSLWESIQSELRASRTHARGKTRVSNNPLLSGLLYCHLCDRPMAHNYGTARGQRYRYYRCPRQQNGLRCPARAVPARVIEESVLSQLRRRLGRERDAAVDVDGLVRRVVERVRYDGLTGGVQLQLARMDSEEAR